MKEEFIFENKGKDEYGSSLCTLFVDGVSVSKCRINRDHGVWAISAWYTREGYGHKGYGKHTMTETVKQMVSLFGEPNAVEYIWNGVNQYVCDWIQSNFDAVCKCPIAVQKYATEDDWSSHRYSLDKEKFFRYFGIVKEAAV